MIEHSDARGVVKESVLKNWNKGASEMAAEALKVLCDVRPELVEQIVKPILENSNFWLKKIACGLLGVEFKNEWGFNSLAVKFGGSRLLFEGLDTLWGEYEEGDRPSFVVVELSDGESVIVSTEKLLKFGIMCGDSELPEPIAIEGEVYYMETYSELANYMADGFPLEDMAPCLSEEERERLYANHRDGFIPCLVCSVRYGYPLHRSNG